MALQALALLPCCNHLPTRHVPIALPAALPAALAEGALRGHIAFAVGYGMQTKTLCRALLLSPQGSLKERYDATKGATGKSYDDWAKQARALWRRLPVAAPPVAQRLALGCLPAAQRMGGARSQAGPTGGVPCALPGRLSALTEGGSTWAEEAAAAATHIPHCCLPARLPLQMRAAYDEAAAGEGW